eukprot:g3916.t1
MHRAAKLERAFLASFVGWFLVFAVRTYFLFNETEHNSLALQDKMAESKQAAFAFEIFGKVQGVYFRKYTKEKASSLKLRGWCLNTEEGTVQGEAFGNPNALSELKSWLEKTGSPKSRIERAVFTDIDVSKGNAYKSFKVIRD